MSQSTAQPNTTMTWPPTREDFVAHMKDALSQSDKQHVKALVFCDNPSLIIFDPIEQFIRCETMTGTASIEDRTVRLIIGKED
jgi:hypothetical protein